MLRRPRFRLNRAAIWAEVVGAARPLQNPSLGVHLKQSLLWAVTCDAVTTSGYRMFSCD